jgi:hypothetical protein
LQGFASLWGSRKVKRTLDGRFQLEKLVASETLVFVFVAILLFGDLYSNDRFLKDIVLPESVGKMEVVNKVIAAVSSKAGRYKLLSNFSPAELSVKLGENVFAVHGNILPMSEMLPVKSSPDTNQEKIIYVVEHTIRRDTSSAEARQLQAGPSGCKMLLNANYVEDGEIHFVDVMECENNNEK